MGYYDASYIQTCYYGQGYLDSGYFDENYLIEGCGIEMYCSAKLEARSVSLIRVSFEAKASLSTRVVNAVSMVANANANADLKAVRLKNLDMLDWMNQISECCFRQGQRLDAIEKEYLIAKDIEPLFGPREGLFDV